MLVCNFGIAVDRSVKKGNEWVSKASFFNCTIWGNRGKAFAEHHKKGSRCAISGHLEMDEWEDKTTHQKRTGVKIVGDEWSFVGGPPKSSTPETNTDNPVDDTPF